MTPEETLIAAAEDMAKYGQAKETFFDSKPMPNGRYDWKTAPACAMGSLARVSGGVQGEGIVNDVQDGGAVHLLAEQIRRDGLMPEYADDYQAVTGFNDRDSTSAEDMILTMKRAAGE